PRRDEAILRNLQMAEALPLQCLHSLAAADAGSWSARYPAGFQAAPIEGAEASLPRGASLAETPHVALEPVLRLLGPVHVDRLAQRPGDPSRARRAQDRRRGDHGLLEDLRRRIGRRAHRLLLDLRAELLELRL